jgi:hypothetical protein
VIKKNNTVSITPQQGVYALFGSFDYTAWQALGEFLDNSISSWWHFDDDYPLEIDIDWDPDWGHGEDAGRLVITDNALGISTEDIDRAFELATPPENLKRLNQFGVGMKIAACWFGRRWIVETSAIGEPLKRTIRWDTGEIVADEIKELNIEESYEDEDLHYTKITITKMLHGPNHAQTIGKIKRHLPKLFRKFAENYEVTIRWNGEVLQDKAPGVLVAPHFKDEEGPDVVWETNFEIKVGNNRTLTGYACVFEKFDRQHTGLNYFWRGRLIQGNVEPFHRPHELFGPLQSFRSGRLYIEIVADDLHVSSNKTTIDFGKSHLKEGDVLQKIKDELRKKDFPLLQQAENYRSNQPPPDLRPKVDATLEIVSTQVEEIGTRYLEEPEEISLASTPEVTSSEDFDNISDRVIRHEVDEIPVEFRVSCVDAGHASPWVSIEWGKKQDDQHIVFLNLAHPFVKRHLTAETLPIIIGFGVSMLYGEYKALSLVQKDELRVVRGFTDRFMRFMANYEEGIDDDSED